MGFMPEKSINYTPTDLKMSVQSSPIKLTVDFLKTNSYNWLVILAIEKNIIT